jgi:hypothetical protein
MGRAMYRPWVRRAKLGGERSGNRSERSQRPPLGDQRVLAAEAARIGAVRRKTTCESRPRRLLSASDIAGDLPKRPFARASRPFTTIP